MRRSTTIPITFTKSVDANHAHVGDLVSARTTQIVKLPDGQVVRTGAQVRGHVVIVDHGQQLPLSVYVRALADPTAQLAAQQPTEYDDALHTTTRS